MGNHYLTVSQSLSLFSSLHHHHPLPSHGTPMTTTKSYFCFKEKIGKSLGEMVYCETESRYLKVLSCKSQGHLGLNRVFFWRAGPPPQSVLPHLIGHQLDRTSNRDHICVAIFMSFGCFYLTGTGPACARVGG